MKGASATQGMQGRGMRGGSAGTSASAPVQRTARTSTTKTAKTTMLTITAVLVLLLAETQVQALRMPSSLGRRCGGYTGAGCGVGVSGVGVAGAEGQEYSQMVGSTRSQGQGQRQGQGLRTYMLPEGADKEGESTEGAEETDGTERIEWSTGTEGEGSEGGSGPEGSEPKAPFLGLGFLSKVRWGTLFVGTVLGGVFTVFSLVAPVVFQSSQVSGGGLAGTVGDDISAPVTLFQTVLEDLEGDYVDKIDTAKLFKTGMKAMLSSLDPYTEFEDLQSAKSMQESVSGRYGGVGLVIGNTKAPPKNPRTQPKPSLKPTEGAAVVGAVGDGAGAGVVGVLEGAEAGTAAGAEAGAEELAARGAKWGVTVQDAFEGYAFDADMRAGDRLITVGGVDVTRKDVEQVRDLLRGEPNTDVDIEFARSDYPGTTRVAKMSTLHRQLVRISDVKLATLLGDPQDGVGYIELSGFNTNSGRDFRSALLTLRHTAPHDLSGLVLDLRGNPGGLLDQAVEIVSYLVPEGSEVVAAKGKSDPEVVYKSGTKPLRSPGMRLAVLVNKGSASASEIVSGAIQDLDAGVIVGPSTTYGKGLVQKIVPLPFEGALKYTIAKYYTPSGRCIQAIRYTGGRGEGLVAKGNLGTGEVNPRYPLKGVGGGGGIAPLKQPGGDGEKGGEKGEKQKGGTKEQEKQEPSPPSGSLENEDSVLSGISEKMSGKSMSGTMLASLSYHSQASSQVPGSQGLLAEDLSSSSNVNGAVEIPDSDRNTFYTQNGRAVRDGGGIEPDLFTPPLSIGPAEATLYSQGIYADFAVEYVHSHNVRDRLREAAGAEREARGGLVGDLVAALGRGVETFYVGNGDVRALRMGGGVVMGQGMGGQGQEQGQEQGSATVQGVQGAVVTGADSSETTAALSPSPAYSPSTPSYSASIPAPPAPADPAADAADVARAQRVKRMVNSVGSSGSGAVGVSSQVPQYFFWGEAHAQSESDKVYNEFRKFVLRKIDTGELNIDAVVKPQIEALEKTLKEVGLGDAVAGVEQLRPQIRQALLQDMDKNKKFILDGVELAILSTELPDRLIVYHTVVQDPQVAMAGRLVRGLGVGVGAGEKGKGMVGLVGGEKGVEKVVGVVGAKGGEAVAVGGEGVGVGGGEGVKSTPANAPATTVTYDSLLAGRQQAQ
ncbi:hypothetical protein B484DRAFT_415530 [Ochromonadaceae sp. CCMP2298]|nr:hypothetical protein B484DRAFT_415530 [Ochromonadaceae sp. CCMP2298]